MCPECVPQVPVLFPPPGKCLSLPAWSLCPGLVEEKWACYHLQQEPGRSGLQVASVFHGAPSAVLSAPSCLPALHPFCRQYVNMLTEDGALLVVTARPLTPECKAMSLLLRGPSKLLLSHLSFWHILFLCPCQPHV